MTSNSKVGGQLRQRASRFQKYWPLLSLVTGALLGLNAATYWIAWHWQLSLWQWPWMSVVWWNQYGADYPALFQKAGLIFTGFLLLGVLIAVCFVKAARARQGIERYLHGAARWANQRDLENAGLLNNNGVYVGAWLDKRGNKRYLRHAGAEHVLTFAPTRSGKGVGLVVPTLLSWQQSALVTDLKGELWALTSGWRQQHANNVVLRFEPSSSAGTVPWNPLDEIRINTDNEVGDVQNIALLLIDQDGKGLHDHWRQRAFALLTGCIMHLKHKALKDGTDASIPALDAMLADPDKALSDLWNDMLEYQHTDVVRQVVASTARDMLDTPEKEAGSIVSTAKNAMSLYRDPVVAANVSSSGFHIKDLMNKEKPATLYVVIPPADKDRIMPLMRLLISMVVRVLADKLTFEKGRPVAHYKHRLLMLLDEFVSFGRLDIIHESLAFVAGYGIKCYLIVQDVAQLQKVYGREESISSNCHIHNAYPPNRVETAQHLSNMTGKTTIKRKQYNHSGGGLMAKRSWSWQMTQRPLMTDDEIRHMPGPVKSGDKIVSAGDMLIFAAGFPAVYGQQPLYFQDETFSARAAVPAPTVTDTFYDKQTIKLAKTDE